MVSLHQRALTILSEKVAEAIRESGLAYDFSPNSYTYGAFNACLAARNAVDVIIANERSHDRD